MFFCLLTNTNMYVYVPEKKITNITVLVLFKMSS